MREEARAKLPLQLTHDSLGAGVARDQRAPQAAPPAHPAEEAQQRHGHAYAALRPLAREQFRLLAQRAAQAQAQGARTEALHCAADELTQAVRPGKGHRHGHRLARRGHLAYARSEKTDGVLQIPRGVENALRRPRRPARRAGNDAAHLRLGAQQQARRVLRELLRRREGQGAQLVQAPQPLRQAAVEAAARGLPSQQRVETPELQPAKRLPVEGAEVLDLAYPVLQPRPSHLL